MRSWELHHMENLRIRHKIALLLSIALIADAAIVAKLICMDESTPATTTSLTPHSSRALEDMRTMMRRDKPKA